MTDDAPVFRALADPTRRRILDLLLQQDGRSLGEVAAEFPEMTRFGVMKHLRQLEEAGLVVPRPEGRSTRHFLNPVPIRRLTRRWMDRYREDVADALLDLAADLEGTAAMPESSTQVYRIYVQAAPERIWQALTDPEVSSRYFHGARIRADPERMTSHGPDGELWGDSTVEVFDPPRRLVYGWDSLYSDELAAEPTSRVSFEIEPDAAGSGVCLLTVVHDRLDDSPRTAESVGGAGWMFVLSNLKSLLETGRPLGA